MAVTCTKTITEGTTTKFDSISRHSEEIHCNAPCCVCIEFTAEADPAHCTLCTAAGDANNNTKLVDNSDNDLKMLTPPGKKTRRVVALSLLPTLTVDLPRMHYIAQDYSLLFESNGNGTVQQAQRSDNDRMSSSCNSTLVRVEMGHSHHHRHHTAYHNKLLMGIVR